MKGEWVLFFLQTVNVFSDIKSEEDLEQILSLILTIGMDKLELEDINSILNVIMKYVMHHTDKVFLR